MIPFLFVPLFALPALLMPKLLVQADYNSRDLALAANYFIAMGEEDATQKLASFGSGVGTDWWRAWASENKNRTNFSLNSRLSWMCRILFEPKDQNPLRPPGFGALALPTLTMPRPSWHQYPIARSGETYFVLADGYQLKGRPESMTAYIEYCKSNGVFRRKPVPVPSRIQAMKDFDLLTSSERWKAIKWRDKAVGLSYSFSEGATKERLRHQAERISEK